MFVLDPRVVYVRVSVAVHVDLTDDAMQYRMAELGDMFSADDVVCAEIISNLESVSYVRQVSVVRS